MTEYKMDPEDFLAHYGVKGMRWGVRRSVSGSTKARTTVSRSELRSSAIIVAKTAVKYGLPSAAVALGAGLPIAATLGVSAKILTDPIVKEALAPAGRVLKDLSSSVGSIPMVKLPKVDNPFTLSAAQKKTLKDIEKESNEITAEAKKMSSKMKASRIDRARIANEALSKSASTQAEIDALEKKLSNLK